jgi:hypothetical protein
MINPLQEKSDFKTITDTAYFPKDDGTEKHLKSDDIDLDWDRGSHYKTKLKSKVLPVRGVGVGAGVRNSVDVLEDLDDNSLQIQQSVHLRKVQFKMPNLKKAVQDKQKSEKRDSTQTSKKFIPHDSDKSEMKSSVHKTLSKQLSSLSKQYSKSMSRQLSKLSVESGVYDNVNSSKM